MLNKLQSIGLKMTRDIYTNIKDTDTLESFFEWITSCSINCEEVDCTTAYYTNYPEPKNVNYPLKFL